MVLVEGSIRTRKWKDKNGQDRSTTEITADNIVVLDRRKDGAPGSGSSYSGERHGARDSFPEAGNQGAPPFMGAQDGDEGRIRGGSLLMAFVNYNNKEITAKIVYYGPALSGKTTCLRYIFNNDEVENKGKLITLDTDGDRTLFFDFLPMEIGKLGNYSIKIQLYTVPGQVAYDTTRKLVLQGADGVVFVADSQVVMREQNNESFTNLKKNLKLNNLQFEKIPLIFQFNKRDLKEILPLTALNKDLNPDNKAFFPTVATNGENVLEGLHAIIKLVILHLKNQLSIFQKDKTVMFSREEITSSSPQAAEKEVVLKDMVEEIPPGRHRGRGSIRTLLPHDRCRGFASSPWPTRISSTWRRSGRSRPKNRTSTSPRSISPRKSAATPTPTPSVPAPPLPGAADEETGEHAPSSAAPPSRPMTCPSPSRSPTALTACRSTST